MDSDGADAARVDGDKKEEKAATEAVHLRREIGLLPAISFIIGTVVGSGIFIAPKGVLMNSGSVGLSLLVWALCGVLSMFGETRLLIVCFIHYDQSIMLLRWCNDTSNSRFIHYSCWTAKIFPNSRLVCVWGVCGSWICVARRLDRTEVLPGGDHVIERESHDEMND